MFERRDSKGSSEDFESSGVDSEPDEPFGSEEALGMKEGGVLGWRRKMWGEGESEKLFGR